MNEFDDYEVDDILNNRDKKKKKNSKNKGNRGERNLVEILNKRFNTKEFSRVVGSGNRWSQVSHVAKNYIGDIVCPENFKFVIECKFGYPQIDLFKSLTGGDPLLDSFLKQAQEDGKRSCKDCLLFWKRDRQPWLTFIKTKILPKKHKLNYCLIYRDWTCLPTATIFECDDSFFMVD